MKQDEVFETLFKVADILKSRRIPNVLVGAFAFSALGGARATLDVDFMITADSKGLDTLKQKARAMEFEQDKDWERENPLLKDLQIRLIHRGIPVDIMLPRDSHDREVIERRKRKKMHGKTMWIPTAEDFIIQKLKVGRPRDFEDALVILVYHKRKMDRNYLYQWASSLNIVEEMNYLFSRLD